MDAALAAAHAMLAACFLFSALDKLLRPAAARAEVDAILGASGWLPAGNGFAKAALGATIAVQAIGALLLASGAARTIGAALLLAFLLPATLAAHRFWAVPAARRTEVLNHFLGNLAIAGGLLLVILHEGGR